LNDRSEKILPVLLQAWRDKKFFVADECIRYSAGEALAELGQIEPDKVMPILLESLRDRDEEIVYAATRALRLIGPEDKVVKTLVDLIQDKREGVSNYAGWQLRELGKAVVPALIIALNDKDPD